MKIKLGDKINAMLGLSINEWLIKRIFSANSKTMFVVESEHGAIITVDSDQMKDGIKNAKQGQTELTEVEI